MIMKKKVIKKSAPKSEFFDLTQVLGIAADLKDGKFYSCTSVCENDRVHEETVFVQDGVTTFGSASNGKGFKYREHKNGKWS
jgi:hypothetical protein